MQNFHIKSVLLGIGIGIVLTSILSMIYLTGERPKMSKEEIIAQAKAYGLVEKTELLRTASPESRADEAKRQEGIKINTGASQEKTPAASPPAATSSPAPAAAPIAASTAAPAEETKILISPGDSSEMVAGKLVQAGLIADRAAFIKEITAMGLSGEINIGEYRIKKGTEIKSIIKQITVSK